MRISKLKAGVRPDAGFAAKKAAQPAACAKAIAAPRAASEYRWEQF